MEQTEREKKEQAYITQLKKNMNPEDVAGLYHLYQKLTEKSYFRTDVGFGFLAELRDYLVKNGYQIDAYTMPQSQANKKVSETHTDAHLRRKYERLCEKQEQTEKEVERLNLLRIRLTIAVVALAVAVIDTSMLNRKCRINTHTGRNSWMHARRNCRSGKKS